MRVLSNILCILSSIIALSCMQNDDIVIMQNVDNHWSTSKKLHFEWEINDFNQPKNIRFVIRNNEEYPYANLFLIAHFSEKGSKSIITDTINYAMAKNNGDWIGTGFGNVKELFVEYKNKYRFPKKGIYQINIIQGMRNKDLKGIEDIGVKIEPIKK